MLTRPHLEILNHFSNEMHEIIIFYEKQLRHLRMVPLCMCLLGYRRKMEGNQVLIKQIYITIELNVN